MVAIEKLGIKCMQYIAALALVVGMASTASTSWVWFHQPKMPEEMKKIKRLKQAN